MSTGRLAAGYAAVTAAFLLAVLSLQVPWAGGEDDSTRLMWNRQEDPSSGGSRQAIYYFDDEANVFPPDLARFRAAAVMAAVGTALLGLLGPIVAVPLAAANKTTRLASWTAVVAGLLLVAAVPVWAAAEGSDAFGLGLWLCALSGILSFVAAAKLAPARERAFPVTGPS